MANTNETLTIKALEGLDSKEAAAMFVARNAEGLRAEEEQLLAAWLEKSKENRKEYETADKLWRTFVNIRGDEIQAAMRERADAERRKRGRSRWAIASIVVLLIAAAVGFLFTSKLAPWQADSKKVAPVTVSVVPFSTLRGEIKEENLPDGSHVTMDADSIIVGRFGSSGRQVHLQRGRSLFSTIADRTKPFVVVAGDRSVVAVGTRFDVNLLKDGIIVTLLEGHVVIEGKEKGGSPVVLEPGQQFVERGGRSSVVTLGEAAANAVAWRAGFFYFKDQPLSEAVQLVNRHIQDQFVIADPALESVLITGQIPTRDAAAFSKALSEQHRVESTKNGKQIELRAKPDPSAGILP